MGSRRAVLLWVAWLAGCGATATPVSPTPRAKKQERTFSSFEAGLLTDRDPVLPGRGTRYRTREETWPVGATVRVELSSSDFDAFLIVQTPSGRQLENDDATPGRSLDAAVELRVTEAGPHRVIITSYDAGGTGRYRLRIAGRSGGPAPAPAPGRGASPGPRGNGPRGNEPRGNEPRGNEPGRLAGITAAHNAVRARVGATPALPPLTWSPDLAAHAQRWADRLAANGCGLQHSGDAYGENLAGYGGIEASPDRVVEGWASEQRCYTFGPFQRGDRCEGNCGACGHYTQVVWRGTRRVGCGVATCDGGREVWVCKYDPPGNMIGERPY
ncbi:MAG: hypothetical protein KC619_10580 [Myxococcales bacterium]|nr:hypothetical protein [Myxococcales bacterium]